MSGRQKKWAAIAALAVCSCTSALADVADRYSTAGATVRDKRSGWSASLFVSSLANTRARDDESLRLRGSSVVHAQLSQRLGRGLRLSFDVFNVFDQHGGGALGYADASRLWSQAGTPEHFLVNPAEPRGFRLRLQKTF